MGDDGWNGTIGSGTKCPVGVAMLIVWVYAGFHALLGVGRGAQR